VLCPSALAEDGPLWPARAWAPAHALTQNRKQWTSISRGPPSWWLTCRMTSMTSIGDQSNNEVWRNSPCRFVALSLRLHRSPARTWLRPVLDLPSCRPARCLALGPTVRRYVRRPLSTHPARGHRHELPSCPIMRLTCSAAISCSPERPASGSRNVP